MVTIVPKYSGERQMQTVRENAVLDIPEDDGLMELKEVAFEIAKLKGVAASDRAARIVNNPAQQAHIKEEAEKRAYAILQGEMQAEIDRLLVENRKKIPVLDQDLPVISMRQPTDMAGELKKEVKPKLAVQPVKKEGFLASNKRTLMSLVYKVIGFPLGIMGWVKEAFSYNLAANPKVVVAGFAGFIMAAGATLHYFKYF